jgi:hypothetical protein
MSKRKARRPSGQSGTVPFNLRLPPQATGTVAAAYRDTFPSRRHSGWIKLILEPTSSGNVSAADVTTNLPKGSRGVYKITFALSVPGSNIFQSEINLNGVMSAGTSLIIHPPGPEQIVVDLIDPRAELNTLRLFLHRNSDSRVSHISVNITGEGFDEVERWAHNTIAPIISFLSYAHDVGIDFTAYQITEESTGVLLYRVGCLGQPKALADTHISLANILTPQIRRLLSAYREGLNSTNPFYQVISFWKVIEGTKYLREARNKTAVAKGRTPRAPQTAEVIPDSLNDVQDSTNNLLPATEFTPFLGKKFGAVLDEIGFRARNAVAHLDPTADPLLTDNIDDFVSVISITPVLRFIARVKIANEIEDVRLDTVESQP